MTERAEITAVIADLIDAWARHDAEAYAALFTEDASYISYVGTYYQGRGDIEASHRTLWSKFLGGTKLADEILDVRFLGQDIAVVTGRGDTYKGAKPGKLSKIQTYTLTRTDGRWLIAAFQNTKRSPLMEAVSFKVAPGLVPAAAK